MTGAKKEKNCITSGAIPDGWEISIYKVPDPLFLDDNVKSIGITGEFCRGKTFFCRLLTENEMVFEKGDDLRGKGSEGNLTDEYIAYNTPLRLGDGFLYREKSTVCHPHEGGKLLLPERFFAGAPPPFNYPTQLHTINNTTSHTAQHTSTPNHTPCNTLPHTLHKHPVTPCYTLPNTFNFGGLGKMPCVAHLSVLKYNFRHLSMKA